MELGTCPVCNGSGRVAADPDKSYRVVYGYDKDTHTLMCCNCGGQYQFAGGPTGRVRLRKDNQEPCVHEYRGVNLGRCYYGYTCQHCGDYYTIDSGD
jgi:hypothetical protein